MARLFVALWPPPSIVAELQALPRRDERGVRWMPPESWHVTLRFIGEADPDVVAGRLDGAHLPPATAVLGPRVGRLGRNLVVVPVAGVDELAASVSAATAGVGQPPDAREFSGHLTLARLRDGARSVLVGAPVSGTFAAAEVVLASSSTERDGAVYTALRRWPTG